MNILALESFYGGSHKAFIDGWIEHSSHNWTLLTLPPVNWKWRMRHSAITFADMITGENDVEKWDLIFVSDMLNLAEFLGLAPNSVKHLPTVLYFHENQLTYPDRFSEERDYHYGMTNIVSTLAASEIWFNSEFHKTSFIESVPHFLKMMPNPRIPAIAGRVSARSKVFYPGIPEMTSLSKVRNETLTILWAARWEHDKNPGAFFEAMKQLKEQGLRFRLNVIGEQFEEIPPEFVWAKEYFADEIIKFGFRESRCDYIDTLCNSDIIVSTANHEFFGISVVEAIAARCYPLLPDRLSYPEIIGTLGAKNREEFLYAGSVDSLVCRIRSIGELFYSGELWNGDFDRLSEQAVKFSWRYTASAMDSALEKVLRKRYDIL